MEIKVGDKIIVDKGILGTDFGELVSVDGFSCGGYNGTYKTIDGKTHIYDQTVHKISKEDSL